MKWSSGRWVHNSGRGGDGSAGYGIVEMFVGRGTMLEHVRRGVLDGTTIWIRGSGQRRVGGGGTVKVLKFRKF